MVHRDTAQHLTAQRYKIDTLLRMVREGQIRVPDFQRPLRWGPLDVARLFDSIYRGFPIGTLLFWIREAQAGDVKLGPVEIPADATDRAYWVVDGQQRLTSLAAALLPTSTPGYGTFDLVFDLETEEFAHRRLDDDDTKIPVREAYDLTKVLKWVAERSLDGELQERAFNLAERLRNYEVPAYEVGADNESILREVFDRTNTSGKSMKKSEVFAALTTAGGNSGGGIAALKAEIEALGYGALPEGNTLHYCVLATQGKDVLRDFRVELGSSERADRAMRATVRSLERTVEFLRTWADVPHFSLIPYQHQTVGLVRFFAIHRDPSQATLELLKRWYWQAAEVGPIPRKGNTGTLKATLSAISEGMEFDSVASLLALTRESYAGIDLSGFRLSDASTRIAVCALAYARPRSLLTGEEVNVTDAIEGSGKDAFARLFERLASPLESAVANRIIVSSDDSQTLASDELRMRISEADEPMLSSLTLPSDSRELLAAEDPELFLEKRSEGLDRYVSDFLIARTERDRAIRPSIEQVLSDAE